MQEMIDICDFAVGLSRQLHGVTIATERADHRMMETWHPLGVVRRHLRIQFSRCGMVMECSAGVGLRRSRRLEAVREDAADRAGRARRSCVVRCVDLARTPRRGCVLSWSAAQKWGSSWSTTGASRSCRRRARRRWAGRSRRAWPERFARAILELGGNNAAIVAPSADLDLGIAGGRLRRDRYRRPTLHDAAAALCSRQHL